MWSWWRSKCTGRSRIFFRLKESWCVWWLLGQYDAREVGWGGLDLILRAVRARGRLLRSDKEMATHSSVLAWRIPGTVGPGGLLSMGSHRVGHDWKDLKAAAAYHLDPQSALWLLCEEGSGGRAEWRSRGWVNAPVLRVVSQVCILGRLFPGLWSSNLAYVLAFPFVKWVGLQYPSQAIVVKSEWEITQQSLGELEVEGGCSDDPAIKKNLKKKKEVLIKEFKVAVAGDREGSGKRSRTPEAGPPDREAGSPAGGGGRARRLDLPRSPLPVCFQEQVWLPPGGQGFPPESHSHPGCLLPVLQRTCPSPDWPAFRWVPHLLPCSPRGWTLTTL